MIILDAGRRRRPPENRARIEPSERVDFALFGLRLVHLFALHHLALREAFRQYPRPTMAETIGQSPHMRNTPR